MPQQTVTCKIEGFDKLEKALVDLEAKVAKKVAKDAMRAGAKPIQVAAQNNAPVRTGLMRKMIKVLSGRAKPGMVRSLVSIGKKYFKGKAFYGAFQEFGWKQGSRKLGNKRRQIEGKHFIEKAFDSKREESLKIIKDTLGAGIEREAKGK